MRKLFIVLVLSVLVGPGSALASSAPAADPVYIAGSHYTAVLDQSSGHWQLLSLNGQSQDIDTGSCTTGAVHPHGLWLLVRDAQGRPELLAPSGTALPKGASDHIPLRACQLASGNALSAPQALIDLLAANTGAIYIRD